MAEIHNRKVGVAPVAQTDFLSNLKKLFYRSAPVWALAVIAVLAIVNVSLYNRLSQVSSQPTPSMRVVSLINTQSAPLAKGTLIMDQSGEYGTLVVDKLPVLDVDKQYQIWLIKNGQHTSGGLFSVNDSGYASVEIMAPLFLSQYDSIGVSVEPSGGSPEPTGNRLLGGDFSQ